MVSVYLLAKDYTDRLETPFPLAKGTFVQLRMMTVYRLAMEWAYPRAWSILFQMSRETAVRLKTAMVCQVGDWHFFLQVKEITSRLEKENGDLQAKNKMTV